MHSLKERSETTVGLLSVAMLLMSPVFLPGQQGGALAQSLAEAQEQSDVFNRAQRPFLLEADLTVQLAKPTQGQVTIQWQSKNHWRREMAYGAYKESVVRVGEWEYAQRNVGFAPLRTTQVIELLEFAKGRTHFEPSRTRTRKRGGTVLTCIELRSNDSKTSYELCTDPVTHDIASFSPWVYGLEGGDAEFSDYTEIEGMRFPEHLELRVGTDIAVSIHLTKLQEEPFDASLLTPPPGAIERRFCDIMTAPVLIHRPDLSSLRFFPEDVRVKFQVTILKDGSVSSVQVISQSSANVADRLRRAYMDAKYKPAMCGAEPVVADEDVGIDFTH
jgi:hypothetical protein